MRYRSAARLQGHDGSTSERALGAPPLGFKASGNGGGVLIPVPEELELVRLILDLRGRRRMNYRAICQELTARGFSPKRASRWQPNTIKKLWDGRARYEVLLLDAA